MAGHGSASAGSSGTSAGTTPADFLTGAWATLLADAANDIVARFQLANLRWVLLAVAAMPILFTLQNIISVLQGVVSVATRTAESAAVAGLLLAAASITVRLLDERHLISTMPDWVHALLVDAWTVVAATAVVAALRVLRTLPLGRPAGATGSD